MRRKALVLVLLVTAAVVVVRVSPAGANQSVAVQDDVFGAKRVAVKPGESVTWTNPGGPGTVHAHNVDFDDGSFTVPASPVFGPWMATRAFMGAGTYAYHCHEHGAPGGFGMSGVVYVNALGDVPPVAALSISPNPAEIGQSVNFDATASSDADGTVTKYQWDLDGNGSLETDTGTTPKTSRTYMTAGTINVRVLVTDEKGMTNSETFTLDINGSGPPPAPTSLPAAPNVDKLAPSVSEYAVTNHAFRAGKDPTPASGTARKKTATGTTFRYKLSEAATVKIDLQQLLPGRNKGKACLKPAATLRRAKKCLRAVFRGALTRASYVGANSVAFSGRIGSKKLKPGGYRATLTATDAAKNTSQARTISFTIVKARLRTPL